MASEAGVSPRRVDPCWAWGGPETTTDTNLRGGEPGNHFTGGGEEGEGEDQSGSRHERKKRGGREGAGRGSRPTREREREREGGQTRGETDLSTFIIVFNPATAQLLNPEFPFRVIWNPGTCLSS